MLLRTSLILLLLTTSLKCLSQEVDNVLWLNYAIKHPVTDKFSYGGDVGLRGLITNQDWNQILIRPSASYAFNQTFSVSGAGALFNTFYEKQYNVHEFRLHQEINISWPDLTVVYFFYRIRVEERFFYYETLPDDFNLRLRYLVGAESGDIRPFGMKSSIYFQTIWEGFKTIGSENAIELFVNQARIHFAFGHRIRENFRYEFHYILQRSRQFSDSGLETTQNMFRLRLFHRIN